MRKQFNSIQEFKIIMDKNHTKTPATNTLDYVLYSLVFGVFAAISYTFILWLDF